MTMNYSRRDLVRVLIGGAAGYALMPRAFAQFGPPAGKIALRYNENPYGPSAAAIKAADEATRLGAYYGDDVIPLLLDKIAKANGLTRENMVLSSGSNEALQASYVAWGARGKVLQPALTYMDHVPYARTMGVELKTVPLNADLTMNLDRLADAVTNDVSLVYICNPNNPTARLLDGDELRSFCRTVSKKALVLVDEAYNELTEDPQYSSMVDLVRAGENIVVAKTFSKLYGMAGMRIGYAMAQPETAREIAAHVATWQNVSGLAAALACYGDEDFIGFSRSKIFEGRKLVNQTFRENGIEPVPSQTNFVFADIGRNAAEFQRRMAARDVLIRGNYAPFSNYVRVSMGKIEDIEVFREVFGEVIRA